jgi:hypothetical protein
MRDLEELAAALPAWLAWVERALTVADGELPIEREACARR